MIDETYTPNFNWLPEPPTNNEKLKEVQELRVGAVNILLAMDADAPCYQTTGYLVREYDEQILNLSPLCAS